MSELKILFPADQFVMLGRRQVRLRPVRLSHLEDFGATTGSLIAMLGTASVEQVATWAERHARPMRRLLRATTSLNRWQVWRLPFPVAAQLLAQVVRVNADFFGQALPAMVRALDGAPLPSA